MNISPAINNTELLLTAPVESKFDSPAACAARGDREKLRVELSDDVDYFDSLVQDPAIRGKIGDDRSPALETVRPLATVGSIFLRVWEGDKPLGGFILVPKWVSVYEVHTLLSEDGRGAKGVEAGKQMVSWAFTHSNCLRLVSYCPDFCRESLVFAHAIGGRTDFRRENVFVKHGKRVGCTYVSLTLWEWLRKAAANYVDYGREFHRQLVELTPHEPHDEDEAHDAMVGLAIYMAVTGRMIKKAELVYNQWARVAGYEPISVLGERDGVITVDIRSAVIRIDQIGNIQPG